MLISVLSSADWESVGRLLLRPAPSVLGDVEAAVVNSHRRRSLLLQPRCLLRGRQHIDCLRVMCEVTLLN